MEVTELTDITYTSNLVKLRPGHINVVLVLTDATKNILLSKFAKEVYSFTGSVFTSPFSTYSILRKYSLREYASYAHILESIWYYIKSILYCSITLSDSILYFGRVLSEGILYFDRTFL